MKKRVGKMMSILLATVLSVSTLSVGAGAVDSAVTVEYNYSETVRVGTIRYISQLDGKTSKSPRSSYFYDDYWGAYWLVPHPELKCYGPGWECGTASVSMALSYVGISKIPKEILDQHNGETRFDGWGADVLYPSIETGLEQFLNGKGKYSPVVVHFKEGTEGYPDGHFVLLIGRTEEGGYQALDCNSDTLWVLQTTDKKYAGIDDVFQYYNENAVMDTLPEGVSPTNLKLQIAPTVNDVAVSVSLFGTRPKTSAPKTTSVWTRSGPGKSYDLATKHTMGDTLTAIGYSKNKHGNIWYYLDDETYIYGGNVTIQDYLSTASISGASAPSGDLPYGRAYGLAGKITSSGNKLIKITATVKNSNGGTVLTKTDNIKGMYSLENSKLDQAMTFNTLERGSYTYEVSVEESVDDGTKCVSIQTVLYTGKFNVT